MVLPPCFDGGSGEIVGEDRIVGITFCAHHGGTDLAEAYTVSPSCAGEDETGGYVMGRHLFIYNESGAVEVGFGERPTDLQLLAYDEAALASDDF